MKGKMPPKGMPPKDMGKGMGKGQHLMPGGMMMADKDMQKMKGEMYGKGKKGK